MEVRLEVCVLCSYENEWWDELERVMEVHGEDWLLKKRDDEVIESDFDEFWLDRSVNCFIVDRLHVPICKVCLLDAVTAIEAYIDPES